MYDKSLSEQSRALADGELSSVELTRLYLERIKQLDGNYNSYITVTEELALEQARAADERRATGNASALTGIPLAHKDLFCTEGVKTTCGSKILDNFVAPYESTVTRKFKEAGSVMLGKTNMDEFAMGSSNENSHYGAVKNPWDTRAIPGGSSGGSAACVAARLAAGATGTDTGGSIRQPASHCGITGLKPTYGRVSRYGMIAYASSLDQAGPMTQTAEDAALMLNVMAGYDHRDSTCLDREVPDYTASLNDSLEGLTIGLPKEYFSTGLDSEVEQCVRDAVAEYEKLGARVREVSLPNLELSIPSYYVIAPAEASSNLSRFDGARFGHRCDNPVDLMDMYKRSRSEGFGEEVKRRILVGTYALSAGYYDAYYKKAQKIRRLIRDDFMNAFEQCDIIMGPNAPTSAFDIGEKSDDPVAMYLSDIYTLSVNLAGLPGMSIPAGMANGRPAGLQMIGRHFDESRLLNVAHRFQQATEFHKQFPVNS
ncbi:Asp-tRNA(Asn)/Glu-tRNA(Gln) amidotransferase subunit GatA [Endozoicomonas sp. 8E]|uniref:Asp-tRNA(Asn)/Glu-tRNA(Gln) amidotransferase subunit GatA n=1 Tax=Endozoicomonas sp. 8E TaxID=3035692 RepID=UPI002938DB68|nr:Asp-tRNA(Asn)/Glu-tRNA(Gln) amidotransferase subunit GatA [Endozoicomonas sp. 8E]WOG29405.1 Asp-tRNA(Asn)/Glu-tRNA(Gln) amidotransferase subunit GatA [Endozoicomonas sp. 8E]